MKAKEDKRGRKITVDDNFIDEFFDFYASVELYYTPMLVPTRIMTNWAKPKLVAADVIKEENADSQVIYRLIRQLIPGKKRFSKKYEPILDAYREKYKRIASIETRELLNMTSEMLKHIMQKLLQDDKMTVKDFVEVARVHLETGGHIQTEEREDRKERLDVVGKKVKDEDVEESARLLNLLNG